MCAAAAMHPPWPSHEHVCAHLVGALEVVAHLEQLYPWHQSVVQAPFSVSFSGCSPIPHSTCGWALSTKLPHPMTVRPVHTPKDSTQVSARGARQTTAGEQADVGLHDSFPSSAWSDMSVHHLAAIDVAACVKDDRNDYSPSNHAANYCTGVRAAAGGN